MRRGHDYGDAVFDGLNRRVRKIVIGDDANTTTEHAYHNTAWQVLEIRRGLDGADPAATASAYKEYAWDLRYIDAPICRWWDADADGQMEPTAGEQHYYTNDAQFNATALIDANSGSVVERYMYDPYGKPTFLDANWTPIPASAYENEILYCGYRYDPETGLYQVRNRYLNWLLGRWDTTDPKGYVDSVNLYQYAFGAPTMFVDWLGEAAAEALAEARKRVDAARPDPDDYRDKNGRMGSQYATDYNTWLEAKKEVARLEQKVAEEREKMLQDFYKSITAKLLENAGTALDVAAEIAGTLQSARPRARAVSIPANKANRSIPRIPGAESPRPTTNINNGPMYDNNTGRVRRPDGTLGGKNEIADRMRGNTSKKPPVVDNTPTVGQQAWGKIRGAATAALSEQIGDAIGAISQFTPKTDCGRWYKQVIDLSMQAAKTGAPSCCDKIAPTQMLEGYRGSCALLIGEAGGSTGASMSGFIRFSEWAAGECRKCAKSRTVKFSKYTGDK